jgi:hypothetical protein
VTIHLSLNEEMFRTLVAGGIVEDKARVGRDGSEVEIVVKLILSDIGFYKMRRALDDAERQQRG